MNVSSANTNYVNVPADMPVARRREAEVQQQTPQQIPASLQNKKNANTSTPGSFSAYA